MVKAVGLPSTEMSKSGAAALGVDWTCSARNARYLSGGNITLQGNFDPSRLLSSASGDKKDGSPNDK